MFQKKIVKKTKYLVFICFFKGLQMVELKKDEKNGILPTINALKWFIKKEIRKFYSFLTNILATLYL